MTENEQSPDRISAGALLTPDQVRRVRRRSNAWGAALVLHAWSIILTAGAMVVLLPNPVTYILAVMLVGSRQLGLLILMHDAAHGALFRTPWMNRWVAQLLCAWPTLADTPTYRAYHLRHHRHTQGAADPDLVLTGHYPITPASLRRKLWRDVTGRTGFAQRRGQLLQALGEPGWPLKRRVRHFWSALGPQLLANIVLAIAAWAGGHPWLYLTLWLIPLLTWQQLVLRVRNIAEHACVRAADDPFSNARTTLVGWVERVFVAPYWVNYHLEHHLIMWVPCYRLTTLREFLCQNGYQSRMETERGYRAVLRRVIDVNSEDGPRRRASGTFARGFEAA